MNVRAILAEILSYSIFFVLVTVLNYILCNYLVIQIIDQVIEFQFFLFFLFGFVSIGSKLLNASLNKGLSIYLGGIGVKMIVALIYVMPKLLNSNDQQEYLALFFVVNYLLYLSYSVFRIIRKKILE